MSEEETKEIRITWYGNPRVNGDPGAKDVTTLYLVEEGGREFRLAFRTHPFGSSVSMEDEPGVLYTDREENAVRCQVLELGRDCGIRTARDEIVEGLSPLAVRGVILAHRFCEGREVVIKGIAEEGGEGLTVYVGGCPTDLARCLW